MRVAVCQLRPVPGDVRWNADAVVRAIGCADADLVVFPEMFLTGYARPDADGASEALERICDAASASGAVAVVGAPMMEGGRLFNCAVACSDSMTVYRKIHLPSFGPFSEGDVFSPGSEPAVFRCGGMRVGLSVCYDIFFPELTKACSMSGADVNVCISASPVSSRPFFERVLPARALECTSYLVFANNIGDQGGMEFFGGSRVLSPLGETIAQSEEEGIIVSDIDADTLSEARLGRPVLKDTVWLGPVVGER